MGSEAADFSQKKSSSGVLQRCFVYWTVSRRLFIMYTLKAWEFPLQQGMHVTIIHSHLLHTPMRPADSNNSRVSHVNTGVFLGNLCGSRASVLCKYVRNNLIKAQSLMKF